MKKRPNELTRYIGTPDGVGEYLPANPPFASMPREPTTGDLELARIQAETLVRLGRMNLKATRAREDAAVRIESHKTDAIRAQAWAAQEIERMRTRARETTDLISSTEKMMCSALAVYRGTPSSFKVRAKTKLSGFFGRSCTMTVQAEFHESYYYRGPAK